MKAIPSLPGKFFHDEPSWLSWVLTATVVALFASSALGFLFAARRARPRL